MTRVSLRSRTLQLVQPFRISHMTVRSVECVALDISHDGHEGHGEVTIGPWRADTAWGVAKTAREIVSAVLPEHAPPAAPTVDHVCGMHHASGKAGALLAEMALLDLIGRREARPVWDVAGLPQPPARIPIWTTVAIGDAVPAAPRLKIKVGSAADASLLGELAARHRGEVLLDANRGWTADDWDQLRAQVLKLRPAAVEDPTANAALLPIIRADLDGIPVLADEGVNSSREAALAMEQADGVNVKLLKVGGLLEAARILRALTKINGVPMLGCFIETPRAIAYAAQLCGLTALNDLDGHGWLTEPCGSTLRINSSTTGNACLE